MTDEGARPWSSGRSSDGEGQSHDDVVAMRRNGLCFLAGLLCLAACSWVAQAQVTTAYTIPASVPNEGLGYLSQNLGDVNGDGCDDILTSPGTFGSSLGGWARVYSGIDGSLLLTVNGPPTNTNFGCAIAGLGDIDGDGSADFAVGARYDGSAFQSGGAVQIYSGATGTILFTLLGSAAGDNLGSSLCSIADLDGDGLRDLVVGVPGSDFLGTNYGEVRVYSTTSGMPFRQIFGSTPLGFGSIVEAIGDLDGDGAEDIAVALPQAAVGSLQYAGEIQIYSGATGLLLTNLFGTAANDFFGSCFTKGDDMDGDGVPELFVGASYSSPGVWMPNSGRILCLSGLSGAVLGSIWGSGPNEFVGTRMTTLDDFDGDGLRDLVVSYSGRIDPNTSPNSGGFATGGLRVYSSSTFAVLAEVVGDNFDDGLGISIAGGDFNGDGLPDFAAGTYGVKIQGSRAGSIRVFSGQPRTSVPVGGGQPNSLAAELLVNGFWTGTVKGPFISTVQRGQTFSLDFRGAPYCLLALYWSPLLNPGGWIFPGFGSFDLGTGPTFTDVYLALDGFAGGFPYYGTDSLGRFQQSYFLPLGWPIGPFVNLQALIQHEQPWFTWATITAAHQVVVQ